MVARRALVDIGGMPTELPNNDTLFGTGVAYYQKIETFTSSGTWTKPAGALRVDVYGQGPGAGGASGSQQASGTVSRGGGSGGAGGVVRASYNAADLPASVSFTIGAPGLGGASVTTPNTAGTAGGAAGTLSWGDGTAFQASTGASTGGASTSGGGGASGTEINNAGAGLGSVVAGGSGNNTADVGFATGGGPGAGQPTTPGNFDGGSKRLFSGPSVQTLGAAPGIGSTKTNATAATIPYAYNFGMSGLGGPGGWCNADGTAGAGANGFRGGGGGGGGGASLNGNPSGKGGDGGAGILIVVTQGVA